MNKRKAIKCVDLNYHLLPNKGDFIVGALFFVFNMFIAVFVLILLIFTAIIVYIKLLKNRHYLYSLLLLLYPFSFTAAGVLLIARGSAINREDLNSRLGAGEDVHILSADAGFEFTFWGYAFLAAALILLLIVVILIIARLVQSYKSN
ncbi:hypothetical protein [Ornithinibacillus massiliensis]|uniref:hypothetical protein n=1 Tax=Ornithinibacillus massiliensis TaxID=1944633 RepID=UPI001BA84891|nr:hypothetical protein [Ornithinibacillus massiliensis]